MWKKQTTDQKSWVYCVEEIENPKMNSRPRSTTRSLSGQSTSWPTFKDLLTAYQTCRLGKQASFHQTTFEARLGENILKLHREIHQNRYKPLLSVCFVVKHPKPREIFAAHFRDRIVHHLIVSRLTSSWERRFVHSSFACRIGKGTHGALRYLQKKVRSVSQGGRLPVWALQLDIASFFVTIHRPTLRDLLLGTATDPKLRDLIRIVYNHDARIGAVRKGSEEDWNLILPEKTWFNRNVDQGIPIGNLTSQFGANVYLNALDHWICRTLKPGAYLRYMDDLMLLDLDPNRLQGMADPIDRWLRKNRFQNLNAKKTRLTCLNQGIEYLGYRLRQESYPSQPLRIFSKPRKKWEWVKEIRDLERFSFSEPGVRHPLAFPARSKALERKLARINSRIGYLGHGQTYRLRKASLDRLINRTTEDRAIPRELGISRARLKIKGDYKAISSS
ncbi:MAG: reverse transcriptase domain-containing protein [Pseudomonadota bacterium]